MIAIAAAAPFVFAILWGRQYAAGIFAAYSAVWITPPTLFAAAGYGVYLMLELILSPADKKGDEPYRYKYF